MANRQRAENIGAGLGVLAVFVVMFNTLPNPLWTILSIGIFAAVLFTYAHVRDNSSSPVADADNWTTLDSAASFWSGLPRPIPKRWQVGPGRVITQGRREIAHLRVDDQHGEEHWYLMTKVLFPYDPFEVRWRAASTATPHGTAPRYEVDGTGLPDSIRTALQSLPAATVDPGVLTSNGTILLLELTGDQRDSLTDEAMSLFRRIADTIDDVALDAAVASPTPTNGVAHQAITAQVEEPVIEPPVIEPTLDPVAEPVTWPAYPTAADSPASYEVTPYEMPDGYQISASAADSAEPTTELR